LNACKLFGNFPRKTHNNGTNLLKVRINKHRYGVWENNIPSPILAFKIMYNENAKKY
jgi:hypothetical protein